MVNALGTAAHGIAAGFDRLDRTADRIARDADSQDVAANMVDLLRARQDVRANVAVARTADQMIGTLLDELA
ncbi:MAG: flagellar hook protein FlgE [Vicinamibacterales bacterium]